MKKIFLALIFISFCFSHSYSFTIHIPPPLYIPIDSLMEKHLYYNVYPDFKEDVFTYRIEGKTLFFKLKNNIHRYSAISTDTTTRNVRYENYFFSSTAPFDEESEIYFGFDKLLAFSEDSIYVSAHYQKFSIKKGYNTRKFFEIRNIAISKKDLAGLQLLYYPEGAKTGQDQLIAGYAIIPGGKSNTTNHVIELGWSRITSHQNIMTSSYYFSNEFVFNKNHFFIGPKIGGQVSFFFLGLGNEFVYYTDFHDSSLYWVPYIYWGWGNYKLHLNGYVNIHNKNFQNMNKVSIGFSMPVLDLTKKKVKP